MEQSQKEMLDKMKRDIKSLQTEKEDIGNRIQLLSAMPLHEIQFCVYGARFGNKGRGYEEQIEGLHIF